MEPFVRAIVVVARDHVPETDAAAGAILAVVAFALAILHLGVGAVVGAVDFAQRAFFARVRGRGFEVARCRGGAEGRGGFFAGASPGRFFDGGVRRAALVQVVDALVGGSRGFFRCWARAGGGAACSGGEWMRGFGRAGSERGLPEGGGALGD